MNQTNGFKKKERSVDNFAKPGTSKYDENENEIYYKTYDGDECWCEYDEKGNLIHWKCSNGQEMWTKYNEKGNLIYYKDADGVEFWCDYDEKGNLIHSKRGNVEFWCDYDEKGNRINCRDNLWEINCPGVTPIIVQRDYQITYVVGFEDYKTWDVEVDAESGPEKVIETYIRNEKKVIHCRNRSNSFHSWKYYCNGKIVACVSNSEGMETSCQYDDSERMIYLQDDYDQSIWINYDEQGNAHYKNANGEDI